MVKEQGKSWAKMKDCIHITLTYLMKECQKRCIMFFEGEEDEGRK
ncbi:hypothetical protein [Peribacillus asahii]|nr:hypothetical protein [Peribacillus asahii]